MNSYIIMWATNKAGQCKGMKIIDNSSRAGADLVESMQKQGWMAAGFIQSVFSPAALTAGISEYALLENQKEQFNTL